mgnify:CR=1 FL=1
MFKKKNKKLIAIFIAGIFCTFLASIQLTGCNHDTPSNNKETENPDEKLLKLQNSFNWGTSFNQQTKVLTFEKGWKIAAFNFTDAETLDACDFEYLELSYSDLTLPVVIFRLIYSDESYSQVYLQEHLNKAYIKLHTDKKKALKSIYFQTFMTDDYYADSASLKLGDFKLIKEKPVDNKAPVVDKVSGNFDDNITGDEITNKIRTAPHFGQMILLPSTTLSHSVFPQFEQIPNIRK